MQKVNLKLIMLTMLILTNIIQCSEISLTPQDNTKNQINNAELVELKEKVCAALAVLKCTLYKLESILEESNHTNCCEDEQEDDDQNEQEENDDEDDCPSLNFDNCDDCNSCENNSCDNNNSHEINCEPSKLPVNLNINCHDNQKVKFYLQLQTCKAPKANNR